MHVIQHSDLLRQMIPLYENIYLENRITFDGSRMKYADEFYLM